MRFAVPYRRYRVAVITGALRDYPLPENAPEFKGRIIIEWPATSLRDEDKGRRVLPCCLGRVLDEADGEVIPCAGFTVHSPATGLITADVAVYLDKGGEIIRDPGVIWRESDGIPATFRFLVAEMRTIA
jgi:hypothetical protein